MRAELLTHKKVSPGLRITSWGLWPWTLKNRLIHVRKSAKTSTLLHLGFGRRHHACTEIRQASAYLQTSTSHGGEERPKKTGPSSPSSTSGSCRLSARSSQTSTTGLRVRITELLSNCQQRTTEAPLDGPNTSHITPQYTNSERTVSCLTLPETLRSPTLGRFLCHRHHAQHHQCARCDLREQCGRDLPCRRQKDPTALSFQYDCIFRT